jgi:hypothetical protein
MNGSAFKTRSRENSPEKVSFMQSHLGENSKFDSRKESIMTIGSVNNDKIMLSDSESSEE